MAKEVIRLEWNLVAVDDLLCGMDDLTLPLLRLVDCGDDNIAVMANAVLSDVAVKSGERLDALRGEILGGNDDAPAPLHEECKLPSLIEPLKLRDAFSMGEQRGLCSLPAVERHAIEVNVVRVLSQIRT